MKFGHLGSETLPLVWWYVAHVVFRPLSSSESSNFSLQSVKIGTELKLWV